MEADNIDEKKETVSSQEHATASSSLIRSGGFLSLLTLVSRILGLIREMTKAAFLGTSALSDAFSVAFMIPNLFRRLFAEGSISVAFVPTFKEYLLENDTQKTKEFLSSTLTFLSFFVSLTVAIGMIAVPYIVPMFGIEAFDETVLLTRIMFPFLAFISLAALFQGILNTVRVFAPSGLAPILLNVVTILCAYALSPFTANPARAMSIGIIIGGFLEAAIQLPFVLKHGFRFNFTGLKKAMQNPGTRKILRLIGPTIIGMAAYQLNDLVSTALAGNAGEGVVSSLQYSLRLQELILGVFAVSLGTVLLPDLAEYAKTFQWKYFNERLIFAMDVMAFISIPFTFFALQEGEYIIRLLYQNRSFTDESVRLTLSAFKFHIVGLFFIALNRILAPAFYAQSNSKSPTFAGIISFAANIILAALLVSPMKGSGIALALTAASGINTAALLIFLKKNPEIDVKQVLTSALGYSCKMAMFSFVAIIPIYFLSPIVKNLFAGNGRLISYGVPVCILAILFFGLGFLMLILTKDKQTHALVGMFRRKTR
jgi:putative peptidoglycan lipid II flippase